jgi:hypothetical protein
MTTTEIESRLSAVEREIAQIKSQLAPNSPADLFAVLLETWHNDTRFQSDQSAILAHWAYYRLIGLGPAVLPQIFQDLQAGGGPWFVALQAITGEDPVRPEHRSSVALMRQDWLAWARERGYMHE